MSAGWIDLGALGAGGGGGKASNLAALVRAGLPVPRGFVILPGAPIPSTHPLRAPLVVRSSASIEDSPGGAAPGVFDSVRDVAADDLAAAVARVRASVTAAGATLYLRARGIDPSAVAMAVIVQQQVTPELARGVVYTAPDRIAIEAHEGELARAATVDRDTGTAIDVDPGFPLDRDQLRDLCRLAIAAESAIAAGTGADVEWVLGHDRLWIVQARPIVHRPVAAAGPPADALAFSRAEPDLVWRWDVAHNPDPLTPAQIALVHRVEPIAPYRMRVVDGYLYTAARRDPPAAAAPLDAPQLDALWNRIRTAIDAELAPLEAVAAPPLTATVAAYARVFALYAELTAAIGAIRRAGSVDPTITARMIVPREHAAALARAWDVAAPMFAPADVAAAELDTGAIAGTGDVHALAFAIAESDDLLFYRAQAVVRRALLAIATAAGAADPTDIFYFPLVASARADRERQRRIAMPLAISDGKPLAAASIGAGADVWRGRGGGGAARGQVARVEDWGEVTAGAIIVARSLTPAMVVSVRGAAAIVAEFGGILGHGAAMARELGIPYVVGCLGAWSGLASGDDVVVDGDAGVVARLGHAAQ